MNISNAAFPILMARNDKNYWLAFGENARLAERAGVHYGRAFSVEPENVTRDTATFNLPFISLGQVGEGKLMVIGNHTTTAFCVARTVTAGTGALIKMGSVRSTATRMT